MTDWQPIKYLPDCYRESEIQFLARDRNIVFTSFYKKNMVHNAKRPYMLHIFCHPDRYQSAGKWFNPTHYCRITALPAPPGEEP